MYFGHIQFSINFNKTLRVIEILNLSSIHNMSLDAYFASQGQVLPFIQILCSFSSLIIIIIFEKLLPILKFNKITEITFDICRRLLLGVTYHK